MTHWKRLWCWEGLGAGGEGDDRGWDGWMASQTQWTWVWVNSGSWWWTGRPGMLRFMGSQRVGHDWATELNWTEFSSLCYTVGPCWLFILYIVVCICSSQTPNLPLPSIFSFLKNCQTVSKVAAPFHIPLSNAWGLKSVHKFTNTTITGEGCCLSLGSTSKQGWSGSSLWL